MIPKIIHYCWLSNDPYPENIQRCIDSWKRILPEYELILWDTNRFDISSSSWVEQAFKMKKYAFAADYIRMYALYHYGGIYLDSDVEVLKPFDDLLNLPYFIGKENTPSGIEAATLGSEKGWSLAKLMLERYDSKEFLGKDGHMDLRSLPYMLRRCIEFNFKYNSIKDISQFDYESNVINVFPIDYFSPKEWTSGKIYVTPNTYSIHHFAASWMSQSKKKRGVMALVKEKVVLLYRRLGSMTCKDIVLLSNCSLAQQYYDYFYQQYDSPLLNTKLFSDDFVQLLDLIASKRQLRLIFIPQKQTRHPSAGYDFYPLGLIEGTNIEVHFIHSLTLEEAQKDWEEGFKRMVGKKVVIPFVALTEEDIKLFATIPLPKFIISPSETLFKDLNQDNCDSFFWKRFQIMRELRRRIRRAIK